MLSKLQELVYFVAKPFQWISRESSEKKKKTRNSHFVLRIFLKSVFFFNLIWVNSSSWSMDFILDSMKALINVLWVLQSRRMVAGICCNKIEEELFYMYQKAAYALVWKLQQQIKGINVWDFFFGKSMYNIDSGFMKNPLPICLHTVKSRPKLCYLIIFDLVKHSGTIFPFLEYSLVIFR